MFTTVYMVNVDDNLRIKIFKICNTYTYIFWTVFSEGKINCIKRVSVYQLSRWHVHGEFFLGVAHYFHSMPNHLKAKKNTQKKS